MATLATLDPSQPSDGQQVSQGAARIRETRASTIGSFDVEHDLTGPHTFLGGATGTEPANGFANRLFLNTTAKFLERDTGAVWTTLHAINPVIASGGPLLLTGVFQTLASISYNCVNDGGLIVYGQFQAGPEATTWSYKLQHDGVDVAVPGTLNAANVLAGHVFMLPIVAVVLGINAGAHTISLQAAAGSATSANKVLLLGVVC